MIRLIPLLAAFVVLLWHPTEGWSGESDTLLEWDGKWVSSDRGYEITLLVDGQNFNGKIYRDSSMGPQRGKVKGTISIEGHIDVWVSGSALGDRKLRGRLPNLKLDRGRYDKGANFKLTNETRVAAEPSLKEPDPEKLEPSHSPAEWDGKWVGSDRGYEITLLVDGQNFNGKIYRDSSMGPQRGKVKGTISIEGHIDVWISGSALGDRKLRGGLPNLKLDRGRYDKGANFKLTNETRIAAEPSLKELDPEQIARAEREEKARRLAEEEKQLAELARLKATEAERKAELARLKAEEEERARRTELAQKKQAELAARKQAELAARKQAELAARKQAELAARKQAELAARKQAELARRKVEEEERKRQLELARLKAIEAEQKAELARLKAEEEERARQAELARRKTEEAKQQAKLVSSSVHFGTYHALVIGNDEYTDLPELKNGVQDAKDMSLLLKDMYGFEVQTLLNASRSDIIGALSKLRAKLEYDNNLLIYYAGHGFLDVETDEGYWLPVDAGENDPSNWLAVSTITNMVKAIPAKHVMIVADSCYSGTLVRSAPAKLLTAKERDVWLQRMAKKRSRTAMVSGGLEPVMDGGGGKNSPFAKALMDVLRDNQSVMEGNAVYEALKRPVALASSQTPEYSDIRRAGHDGGEFLFVRRGGVKAQASTGEQPKILTDTQNQPSEQADMLFWQSVKDSNNADMLRAYLNKFPNGTFAALAHIKIKALGGSR